MLQKSVEETRLDGIIRRKRQGNLTDSQFFLEMGKLGYSELESIEIIEPHEYTCLSIVEGIFSIHGLKLELILFPVMVCGTIIIILKLYEQLG